MPLLTRTFIRIALVYFVVALLMGLLMVSGPWLDLPSWVPALRPVYFHLFMVGWVTQLIMGVAYWMFPKFSREKPRGSDPLAWITLALLNLGLLLRVVAEPAFVLSSGAGGLWGNSLALSALLQWVAGLLFVVNTWPRVKGR